MSLAFYGDASWNEADVGPPVMVVAGFLATLKQWSDFEKQWTSMLARFGVRYFRMTDFAHFRGPFKDWRVPEADRRALLQGAIAIISKFTWASFGAGVLLEDWELCNRQYRMEEEGFLPYPLCAWACIDHVRLWCIGKNRSRRPYPFEDVAFVFEYGDPEQGHLKRLAKRDFNKILCFGNKLPMDGGAPIGAFQAADFAAWHIRNVMGKFEAGKLDRFRHDFELLFSKVDWKDHHADFSMKRPVERPTSNLYRVTNDDARWNEEPSLIRFCQDYGNIPHRISENDGHDSYRSSDG